MALTWINEAWAQDEKKTFEFLNTIDLMLYLDTYYIDIESILKLLKHNYPDKEDLLDNISEEEMWEYLGDRYNKQISLSEETITTYWVKKNERVAN